MNELNISEGLKKISLSRKTITNVHPEALLDNGKVMPQALDIEEAFLGALMLEKEAYIKVADFVFAEIFYKQQHQIIFNAIQNLFQRTEPIDLLSVTQELKRLGKLEIVGGAYYLTQLTYKVASAAHIEYYARVLLQKYLQREVIRICTETIQNAFEDSVDIFDLIEYATKTIFELIENVTKAREKDLKSIVTETINDLKEAIGNKGLTGVPSGLMEIDRITNGWQKSHFIILAARPAMGKSALMLTFAKNAAIEYNTPVAIFSLEMTSQDIVKRLLSAVTHIRLDKINNANLADYELVQLSQALEKLEKVPLYIDDTSSLSLTELRAKARRLKVQYGIQMIIIDYLQLMSNRDKSNANTNREQEISGISRGLKSLAKELNIPIIALSQVNRAVEKEKENKMPKLSDLRESGSLEQDADMVFFIYRPEYYSREDTEPEMKGAAFLNLAKNRHGRTSEIKLRFVGEYSYFTDWEDIHYFDNLTSAVAANTDFLNDAPSGGVVIPSRMNQINEDDDISRNEIEEDF
ncbi:MAG: replicative DNA helicase [Bacteroidia bacterium]|nr:MAG: replicative DNA helicase [Bacteroidia bacterium]